MDDLTMGPNAGPNADELAALAESMADVLAAESDRRKVHGFIDGKNQLEAQLWERAKELGWFAVGLPESAGGMGLGVRGLAVLHRELGRQAAPGAFISTLSAAQALAEFSDAAKVVSRLAEGQVAVCVPATPTEPGKGLTLSGGKVSGSASELLGTPSAGLALVAVQDGSNTAWALIEVDGKSAKLSERKLWDLTRHFCTLECTGVTPALLVKGADAAKLGRTLATHMGLAVCFDSIGAADSILNQTMDYMKGRTQFDKIIASFQALKHRVARLKVELELARHASSQALQAVETGTPDCQAIVALSKVTVSEAFAAIAGDCVQLHGGVGHTWEFDCHIFLKRSRLNEALVGQNDKELDWMAERMAEATRAGRSVLELPL